MLIRSQNKSILNTSRKPVNYEEDKNKVPMIGMNKPYNIQNTNICNGIFHISFFKALLITKKNFLQEKFRLRSLTKVDQNE
jgi:hypothetical protein